MIDGWLAFSLLLFFEIVIVLIFVLLSMSWNIPITILRYTGNKGRPVLIHSKGRKILRNGIPRLFVRGFKDPVRDYLAENYYPTVRGKYGGLILWEFEDGLLTPALPKKELKKLSEEDKAKYEEAIAVLKSQGVEFSFDEQMYKDLKLKIVDDVDQEFMLQEQHRLDKQYSGGPWAFLSEHAGQITVVIIAVLMLVGVIMWFDKMPEFAAQCADTARSIVNENIARQAADAFAPAG